MKLNYGIHLCYIELDDHFESILKNLLMFIEIYILIPSESHYVFKFFVSGLMKHRDMPDTIL